MGRATERGLAMIAVLASIVILTTIGVALVGLMDTDLLHASIQHAVARSFYVAQAGLEEAKVQVGAALEPQAYTTPSRGVTASFSGGQYTYWVDAGPAKGCGDGLKTLEALGEVPFLRGAIPARVRACGIAGTPIKTALFAVSRVELRGVAARMYLAPYATGTPGGGVDLGSFTEIHFADPEVHFNALSEAVVDTLTLRDAGPVPDYALFGFPTRPLYDPNPAVEDTPWVLGAFGDIIKARPREGSLPNRCGTAYACVTARGSPADLGDIVTLRSPVLSATHNAGSMRHVYMNHVRQLVLPQLSLTAASFLSQAAHNSRNAELNRNAGFPQKIDSVYTPQQFYSVIGYLARHPGEFLRGVVYIDGTFQFLKSVNLGGDAGDVTLAVGGDLLVDEDVQLTNRHDLSTPAGRRTPGIVVLGLTNLTGRPVTVCGGQVVTGTGRMMLCGGQTQRLTVDGLIYTADGMVLEPGASVDQIGAMYHNSRGTSAPGFLNDNATVVLRFDPLALSVFGTGLAILSWQQLR